MPKTLLFEKQTRTAGYRYFGSQGDPGSEHAAGDAHRVRPMPNDSRFSLAAVVRAKYTQPMVEPEPSPFPSSPAPTPGDHLG